MQNWHYIVQALIPFYDRIYEVHRKFPPPTSHRMVNVVFFQFLGRGWTQFDLVIKE